MSRWLQQVVAWRPLSESSVFHAGLGGHAEPGSRTWRDDTTQQLPAAGLGSLVLIGTMELALQSQSNGNATSLVHQPLMVHEAVQGVLLDCQKCARHSSRNDTFRSLGLSPGICPEATCPYSQHHSQSHQPWFSSVCFSSIRSKEWDLPGQFTQHGSAVFRLGLRVDDASGCSVCFHSGRPKRRTHRSQIFLCLEDLEACFSNVCLLARGNPCMGLAMAPCPVLNSGFPVSSRLKIV